MIGSDSGDLKPGRAERPEKLPSEMQIRVDEFERGLRVRDSSKEGYLRKVALFGSFLIELRKKTFEEASKKDVDSFLSKYRNPNTANLYIHVLRTFYKDLKPEVVKDLKLYSIEIPEITPSEILTP